MRRRTLLAAAGMAGFALPAYALAIEPRQRPHVTWYDPQPPGWPAGQRLTIAAIADLHVGAPYMGIERIEAMVDATNALLPDLVVILGDYAPGPRYISRPVSPAQMAASLARLAAPLGRFAILGNHDYWAGPEPWRIALAEAGVPLLENRALRLIADGRPFWLAGTASNLAVRLARRSFRGLDDLPATLRQAPDDAPVILLAHEPDQFPKVPERVALTLSGHTHGGQVRLLGYSPIVPSKFGNRYAYGHVVEDNRHLIVSAGLGVSSLTVRLGMPPEIVMVRLGTAPQLRASNIDAGANGLRPLRV